MYRAGYYYPSQLVGCELALIVTKDNQILGGNVSVNHVSFICIQFIRLIQWAATVKRMISAQESKQKSAAAASKSEDSVSRLASLICDGKEKKIEPKVASV